MRTAKLRVLAGLWIAMGVAPSAHAQWAVVDVGAIAQLVQQVQVMRQQLQTAYDQLEHARETLETTRGGRGMEDLLAGMERNYLPPSWSELEAVLNQRSTRYGALVDDVEGALQANTVLRADELARFSVRDREELEGSRRSAAMLQVTAREAFEASSNRFAQLQQLIDSIPNASDQKAILDLQARIAVEQAMLANEYTKLYVLQQLAQAEDEARRQRLQEQAIASMGSLRSLPPMGL